MVYLTLTLLALAVYWLYVYLRKRCEYFEELGLPYAPGVPLLGNLTWTVLRRQHITRTVKDVYDYLPEAKYIGALDFVRPVILLRDPELIKSVTIKHADNFPDHNIFVDASVDPLFGGALFQMTGDRWREARNLLTPAFTSSKMKAMYSLMIKCAENFVDHMTSLSETKSNNVIASKDLFTRYTNDVIASCAFGIDVDSFKDPKNQFYLLGREATNFDGILAAKLFLTRAFPKLTKLLRVKIVTDRVARFFTDIVRRTVAMRDEQGISRPDMIQLMMDARGKTSADLKIDITQMTAHAFVFFIGGFDTTSTQMCIISHELILNPDVQSKLQAEIDSVLKETNGKPGYEDIIAMPYLDAVFNESMRCHTQNNVIDRVCTKAYELPAALPGGKPFVVQPGMNLLLPVAAIHRDGRYYRNPDKFDPERYLNKKVTINDVKNLGFGIGPRSCIGNRFAILETKILFFYLLAKFNLKPNAKTCENFEYDAASISIKPKGGYWLTVESRK